MKTYQEIKEHIHPPIDDLDLDIPKNPTLLGDLS
jgi:hypothetical protein